MIPDLVLAAGVVVIAVGLISAAIHLLAVHAARELEAAREALAYETVPCWRCGEPRYTYESCHRCGASCKPLTKRRQQREEGSR